MSELLSGSPISRRELLRGALLGGAGLFGASILACGDSGEGSTTPVPTSPQHVTISAPNMTWQKLAPAGALPPARYGHSLVTDGTRLFLFGGRGPSALRDLWIYDIAGDVWQEAQTGSVPPEPRYGHNAIWDMARSRMVIFGGQSGNDFWDNVWEFDPATSQWQRVAPSGPGVGPAARSGAAAAYNNEGHMLISHGLTSGGRVDDTWQLDLASHLWTDISPATKRPVARDGVRGAWDIVKRRLLLFDGQSANEEYLDDLWGWSPEFDWQQIAREPHPTPRRQYSQIYDAKGDRAIFFGGNTKAGPVNDLWIYYVDGENWSQGDPQGSPPAARYGHDMAMAPNISPYLFGGTNGNTMLDDLWHLDILPAT